MASIEIINEQKKKTGKIELADELLSEKLNKAVLYQAVRWYRMGLHHGTVGTKTRADVCRTGKKVYRQKGTGNARHGPMKSAPFVGGGRVFGPHPRNHSFRLPKKVRRLAMREALRAQLKESQFVVLDKLPFQEIKTKQAVTFFKGLGIDGGLLVLDKPAETVEKSVRNIKGFKVVRVDQLNVFDLLKYPKIIFTQESFSLVQKKYLT